MNTVEMLDELQNKALHDEELKNKFLKTKEEEDSLGAFCRVCRELGYEIYPMDVVQAGDEFYAAMKRSTNGGGENSPSWKVRMTFMRCFSPVWNRRRF